MRKCDICSTPIPLGSNRCPNCGFIYRKERKLNGRNDKREENKKEFMSQFVQHPFVNPTIKKSKPKVTPSEEQKAKSQMKIITIVIAISIAVRVLGNLIPMVIDFVDEAVEEYQEPALAYQSYQNIEVLRFDYPDIADKIQPYYDRLLDYPDSLGEAVFYEDYQLVDEELTSVYMSLDFFDHDNDYTRTFYNYGDRWDETISISKELNKGGFYSKDDIQKMATLADVDAEQLYERCLEIYVNTPSLDGETTTESRDYADYWLELYINKSDGERYVSFTITKPSI